MKILVPTDFSDCARDAYHVAIAWAKATNASLHLFHAADVPNDWEDLPAVIRYRDEANKAIALAVRDKLEAWQQEATDQQLSSNIHYRGGHLLGGLDEVLAELQPDLIIIGSQGAGGKDEWFMGSNAQKMVRHSRVPVLVVKDPITDFNLKRVVFASGLFTDDQRAFRHFLDQLTPFAIEEVHIIAIKTDNLFGPPASVMLDALKDFAQLAKAKGYSCQTHYLSDLSVERGVRQYAENHAIDLIGISNHRKHPIKRFFQGSTVEMLVNHAGVPVLSIDYAAS